MYVLFPTYSPSVYSYLEHNAVSVVSKMTGKHVLDLVVEGTDPTFTNYTDVSALFSDGTVKTLLWNQSNNKWLVLK
jgi:hypothetical protein